MQLNKDGFVIKHHESHKKVLNCAIMAPGCEIRIQSGHRGTQRFGQKHLPAIALSFTGSTTRAGPQKMRGEIFSGGLEKHLP